ncbi:MAG TPA: Ca2+-dependent phosphoinositide-specific phospholipase C [Allosphingosinicella sp.]|nr:Ca2+-dependent phosphoinositide-specific phospholipase C [Allosphingosinicella sp.]
MSFENLCYDQLAFKASHNSYERDEDLLEQLQWNDGQRWDGGCRGLELDINRHSDSTNGTSESYFQVSHDQGGEGPTLASYLRDLATFHTNDTAHDPVLVCLDIKSKEGSKTAFPDEIDNYLRSWFDASLICTPGQCMVDPNLDLAPNLKAHGWPLLSALNGRFFFCLSGNNDWKSNYSKTSPRDRLCFADFDVEDTTPPNTTTSQYRAVANVHLYSDNYGNWKDLIPGLRARRLLVRGYILNSSSIWSKAQSAGVNVLATDKVSNNEWAQVGNAPMVPSAPQMS